MNAKRVLLGLSGGVDSSLAAIVLREAGYEVYGHFLDIGLGGEGDAQRVAETLEIPFSVGDVRADLEELVCRPFAEDYLAGRTPSPCARCNPTVKFPALFRAAEAVGAQFVATGHYARIVHDEKGEAFLHRGAESNDQSYMLARLDKSLLGRILFPLGAYEKDTVRAMARGAALHVADKPDSMEICFIPNDDYAAWMEARGHSAPRGKFIGPDGSVLGEHKGIHHYTIGQRRGLGIAAAHRLFVSEIHPATGEIRLSDGSDLFTQQVHCAQLNLLAPLQERQRLSVRIRHSKNEYMATIALEGTRATLKLEVPARAPTQGQLAVFYDGMRVLGSGWICAAP